VRSVKTKVARKYRISGRVQGVGFRYFAERAAHSFGVCGYVKNSPDGTVEVYAIGEASALEVFKHRLVEGPRSAWVEGIDESEMPVHEGYRDFSVQGGW
jgi:acylphosphatase